MIELPKDAKGREIPLDTKVLYDSDGIEFFTDKSMYMRVTDEWWFFGHFWFIDLYASSRSDEIAPHHT